MKKLAIHGKKEVLKQSRLKQLNKAINLGVRWFFAGVRKITLGVR